MQRLTDLREILRYVPHFRDRVFVIAVDGAVVADENFSNVLLDIALLRSLRIGVALVHGAGHQVEKLAAERGIQPSNIDGTGITDPATFEIALSAATRVTHNVLAGLTAVDQRAASSNAVVAHPAGILQGVDQQLTGKVERIDVGLLQGLQDRDIVPVIAPFGWDGEGKTYRLNSDSIAVEVALALKAVKLIYLTTQPGILRGNEVLPQLSISEAELFLKRHGNELSSGSRSRLNNAVRAAKNGVPRVHIIDGREQEGLLGEVFSSRGIGTLVYANEYQAIRPALKKDIRAIYSLVQQGVANEELLQRSRADIERQIQDYYVFEVDRTPVACMALHSFPESAQIELASLFVSSSFENQGIGGKLVQYGEAMARARGASQLFCLSTQTFNFFVHRGFQPGTPADLPQERRDRYNRSGRKSQVLIKPLPDTPVS